MTEDNQKRVMIYKTSPVFPNQRAAKGMRIEKGDPNNVYLAAVVFHNQQASGAQVAYLCVITGENRFDDTGFELQDLYKAMKNPNIKNGIVVADMMGSVVGKVSASVRSPFKRSPLRKPPQRSSSSSSEASLSSMDSFKSFNSTASSSISSFLGGEKRTTCYEIAAGASASAVIAVAASFFN
jgi:hypothetical protein